MKSDDQLSLPDFRPGGTTESSPALQCRDHGREPVRPGGTLDGRKVTRHALQPSLRDGIRGEAHPALKCRATFSRPSGTGRTRETPSKLIRHRETQRRFPLLGWGSTSFDGPDNLLSGWPQATGSTHYSKTHDSRLLPVRRSAPGQQVVRAIEASSVAEQVHDDKISRFHFGHASDSEVAAVVPNGGACRFYRPQAPPLGTAAATSEPAPDVVGSRRPPGDGPQGHAYRPSPGGRRLPSEGMRNGGSPSIHAPNTQRSATVGGTDS